MLRRLLAHVYGSVFRVGLPRTERERAAAMVSSFFLHIHPPHVHRATLQAKTTAGLGIVLLTLFAVLTMTGVLLMFHYVPSVDSAYQSMQDLREVVSFGRILRNSHRWAAHLMVFTVILHLCRVFYTGAYKPPREFNWILGVVLMLLTLFLSFTGYLLPWDQLAYWAITVGSSIAGYAPLVGEKMRFWLLAGNTVGQGALLRFYVLHVMVLPLVMTLILVVHLWRVRKDGGLARAEEEHEVESAPAPAVPIEPATAVGKSYGLMMLVEGDRPPGPEPSADLVASWPHLLFRELLVVLATICVVLGLSLVWDAPLEEIANQVHPPNPAKAPWYFLGLQELVSISALLGGVVVPGGIVLVLFLLPYLDRRPVGVGRWFAPDRRVANTIFTVIFVALVVLTIIGMYFRGPNWDWVWPWAGGPPAGGLGH